MKNPNTITDTKGDKFKGALLAKIKRIRQETRQKIRQLLRSFAQLERFRPNEKTDSQFTDSGNGL